MNEATRAYGREPRVVQGHANTGRMSTSINPLPSVDFSHFPSPLPGSQLGHAAPYLAARWDIKLHIHQNKNQLHQTFSSCVTGNAKSYCFFFVCLLVKADLLY